jgi:chaperonin GroES
MASKLIPLGNKVVVKRDVPKKETPSGIIIPEKALAKEVPQQGVVVSVGPEVGMKAFELANKANVARPFEQTLKEGDVVLFNTFAGSDVKVGPEGNQERFTIMLEDDILAILVTTPDKDEFELAAESVPTGVRKKK